MFNGSLILMWLNMAAVANLMHFLSYLTFMLVYGEWNGPHHTTTAVADLDADDNLDVVVGYACRESEDISWAGVGLWFHQGNETSQAAGRP
jgi:hypothetical protein